MSEALKDKILTLFDFYCKMGVTIPDPENQSSLAYHVIHDHLDILEKVALSLARHRMMTEADHGSQYDQVCAIVRKGLEERLSQ